MDKVSKKQNLFLLVCTLTLNTALFLLSISFYNCVYATNDDYRMSLIVSGAYTGEPSDNLVFMKYPIALLISSLYKITTAVPWYGIATMLCIFIPSCIICYFVLRETKKSGHLVIGFSIYILFYLFIVQKHVVLPQFTLTAAFMALAWVVMLWYMPKNRGIVYIIFTALLAAIAFSIRMKVFFMISPVAILVVVIRLLKEHSEDTKYILKYAVSAVLALVLCLTAQISTNITVDTNYEAFNTARSLVYDYGEIPPYELNKEFYDKVGIDETVYYDISARYLDLDGDITTEKLHSLAEYIEECKNNTPAVERLGNALVTVPSFLFESGLEYQTIFVAILLLISVFIAFRRKKPFIAALVLCTAAGMILEMIYICYISRLIDRLAEVCLLTIAVVCLLSINALISEKSNRIEKKVSNPTTPKKICRVLSVVCFVSVGLCLIVSNQNYISSKSYNQNLINSRLEVLNETASNEKDSFYFYDSYDFIAASSDVFAVYDDTINTDSLGNWYINSPDYFERNEQYGFTSSVDGLIDGSKNIYFASIGNLKNGITLTMKERYNMEPLLVRTIPYANNNIYIYTFVPCG